MNTSTNYGFNEPESTDFVDVSDLSDNWDSADEIIHSLSTNIAPDFDATETYAVGDKVIHENKLYHCTHAHTGAWDASDFETTSVAADTGAHMTYDSSTNTISIPDRMATYVDNTITFS
jgi:hypothetical protein